ncbi:MAG: GtrA family protein [Bacteroidales bacterium]|nr:GtrA family protein [Bacteroidales bacterium]MCF8343647.1 GtrA family protein [Bacteroidales bacterium]MCF8352257.1 GtrA family protein [Bacteroidales bacterium]MCF8375173.1 GtrA family protein [Bacteroidales bacterium]MCF8400705.1 GtrA family protein [Bacteroidales bacterium]
MINRSEQIASTTQQKSPASVVFPTYLQFSKYFIRGIDWFYKPFRKYIPHETFTYAATGGFNTALDIVLYFIFYNFILNKQIVDLGFVAISPYIAAFIFVFPITFTTGFLLAKYVTFTKSLLRGRKQLFRYMLTVGGAILLNYLLLKFFVEYLHIWPTISKIITTVFVVAYSYLAQRYFTFQTGKRLRLLRKGAREKLNL